MPKRKSSIAGEIISGRVSLTGGESKPSEAQNGLEKEILVSLSNDIASIRDKRDILKVIHPKLKKLFNTDDIFICILDKEKETLNPILRVAGERRQKHSGYQALMNSNIPIHDGFIDAVLRSRKPLVFDIEEISNWPKPPEYVSTLREAGLVKSLSRTLYYGEKETGILTFWFDDRKALTFRHTELVQGIGDQISIVVANILAHEEIQNRQKEKEILLAISSDLAAIRAKEDLLPLLKRQLERLSFHNDITIAKVDNNRKTFSAFLINEESDRLDHRDYPRMKYAHHVFPDGVFEKALRAKEPVLFDLEEIVKRPDAPVYVRFLYENGTVEMVGVSLRDRNEEIGALFCFSGQKKSFTKLQLNLVQGIGNQLGTAVANILANEAIKVREHEQSMLLSLSNEIAAVRNREDLFVVINAKLKELFSVRGFGIALIHESRQTHGTFLVGVEDDIRNHSDFKDIVAQQYPVNDGIFDIAVNSKEPVVFSINEISRAPDPPAYVTFWKKLQIQIIIGVALRVGDENLGCLFLHLNPESLSTLSRNLLKGVCSQISIALSNILANERIVEHLAEIRNYKEQLEKEKIYLQEEVFGGFTFSDIIGSGPEMQKVFHLLSQVALTNSTVLVLGETGTGKELVARAIHNSSGRKNQLMVKVNCASIPPNLIESELFGHEKGAFTGAIERRIGKFELANNGSLFLDEIGELPPDLQAKLLRVLQEKEIERIGGKGVIKTDARIIAATNRNLEKEVLEGKFRSDLYYRLNVFPITIPPLRDRKKDIPLLAAYFVEKFSKNAGRKISNISDKVLKDLQIYHWPGNVRELEHLMERSVLMTRGNTIKEVHLPAIDSRQPTTVFKENHLKTYEENERDHILFVLKQCNGKIFGRGGAAEVLGLKVSTLNSKIKKLRIKKDIPFEQD